MSSPATSTSGPGAPSDPTSFPAAPQRPATTQPEDTGPGLAEVRTGWSAVMDRLAADSRVAWTAFHAGSPVSLSQGVLAVAVVEPGTARAIAQRGHDERLRQALIDVLGLDVRIDVLHDPDAARSGSGAGRGSVGGTVPDRAADDRGGAAGPGPQSAEEPTPEGPASQGAVRGIDLVRSATVAGAVDEAPDEPSEDDPDLSGADGVALVARELGAKPIGEIDHS